jgi:hypothetical protein
MMALIIKIYLLGVAIAFLIELATVIRLGIKSSLAIFGSLIFSLLGWIWVVWFLVWVFNAMGWQYDDLQNNPGVIVWRLK